MEGIPIDDKEKTIKGTRMDSLSLLELNALVRRSLEQCLPDEYWIQAELSDVRTLLSGVCTKRSA